MQKLCGCQKLQSHVCPACDLWVTCQQHRSRNRSLEHRKAARASRRSPWALLVSWVCVTLSLFA